MYTNIDQLPNKRDDLLMAIYDSKPDIIILTEVIPKAQRHPIDLATISIPEYTLHVNFELNIADLGTSGKRGIGIYTRDRLSATKISFENSNFEEQLWISIRLLSQDKLLLGGIYRSPSTDITTSTKQLSSLLKIVTDTNPSHLIIMGDFNYPEIDWNYTISRAAGIHPSHIFLHSIQDSLLYQHVTQPTRHRLGESPNTLDLIITNEEGMINKINPLPPIGNSDHICLNVFPSMYTEEPMAPQPRLNLFKGNYGKISEGMQSIDWDTTLQGQPFTDAYRAFCNILKEKTEQHIPITTKQKKKTRTFISHRKQGTYAKKRGTAGTYTQNLTTQWTLDYARFAQLRNQLIGLTRRLRASFEHDLAQDLKSNSKAFWKYVRTIMKTTSRISDLDMGNGRMASTNKEKADTLNSFFCSVFTRENHDDTPILQSTPNDTALDDITLTEEIIKNKLIKLNPNKSPGPDGWHPRVLKEVAEALTPPLLILLRKSLDEGSLPDD